MGARRLAAVCIAACLIPIVVSAKHEQKGESPAAEEGKVMGVMSRRAEPGWAGRQQALHWQALGARGKKQAMSAGKSALRLLTRRQAGPGLRGLDDGPIKRADGVVGFVMGRLKAAAHGRKLIAPSALGEMVHDRVWREERRDPTDRQ